MRVLSVFFLMFFITITSQEKQEKEMEIGTSATKTEAQKISVKEAVEVLTNNSTLDSLENKSPMICKVEKISDNEKEEFDLLMKKSELEKKELTETSLNELMNSNENDQKSLLIVKNNTKCNMILRISGEKKYNIPVPAEKHNAIMVEKGEYQLEGSLCGTGYIAQKNLSKSLLVSINLKNY